MRERLYKSTSDRMLSGVSGGLGEYLDVDSTLVRIAWVAATILSAGIAFLAYIALVIIVPERMAAPTAEEAGGGDEPPAHMPPADRTGATRGSLIGGTALVVIGVLFLVWNFGLLYWFDWGTFWPVVLILLGLLLVARRIGRRGSNG